jgi:hypothetical protein
MAVGSLPGALREASGKKKKLSGINQASDRTRSLLDIKLVSILGKQSFWK